MSNKTRGKYFETHPVVFPVAAGVILLFVMLAVYRTEAVGAVFGDIQSFIVTHFGWWYVLLMSGLLVFTVWLGMSRYGSVRLGPDDEPPEFSTLTWFAMLFSAGMGIGLLFWSVAEPIYHFHDPPMARDGDLDAVRNAMGITLFHWCLHPWALYAMVAMSLAYFGYRRGLPLSFRSVFYPLIGERIHGRLGDLIDILACVATLFGVATSLGLGAMQVNAGLNHLFGVEQSTPVQIALIAGITAIATVSVVLGLKVGIRRLSEANIGLALVLLVIVFLAGPTLFLLNAMVENVGSYVQRLPINSFWTGTFEEDASRRAWLGSWTVFYWGWWIAWSPFVGMFIARVSKGRTVRQFVAGVLIVPTLVSIVWLTVFGNGALHQETNPKAYVAETFPVLVTDSAYDLPMTESGDLVSPGGVELQVTDDGLVTAGGAKVLFEEGALLTIAEQPFEPTEADRFDGVYMAEEVSLSVADFLEQPVLTEDHTGQVDEKVAVAMFVMLEHLSWPSWLGMMSAVTALIATVCIVLFFVTSSDSASMVIDIIASGGNEGSPVGTRLFWAILEGVVGAVLLVAGGLEALQTASITAALPFSIVIVLMCWCLYRGLRSEVVGRRVPASE